MRRSPSIIALVSLLVGLLSAQAAASGLEDLGHKRARGVDLSAIYNLQTHEGVRLGRQAVRGRPFIVAFGFTHCPDVCPTTLLDLSNHLADLGERGDRIAVLFVTVDPARDTAEHLKAYLKSFDPRIVGLTGSATDIATAAHALEAFYQRVDGKNGGYTFDHTLKVAFFDRFGLLAANVDLVRAKHERVKVLLERLLAQ